MVEEVLLPSPFLVFYMYEWEDIGWPAHGDGFRRRYHDIFLFLSADRSPPHFSLQFCLHFGLTTTDRVDGPEHIIATGRLARSYEFTLGQGCMNWHELGMMAFWEKGNLSYRDGMRKRDPQEIPQGVALRCPFVLD